MADFVDNLSLEICELRHTKKEKKKNSQLRRGGNSIRVGPRVYCGASRVAAAQIVPRVLVTTINLDDNSLEVKQTSGYLLYSGSSALYRDKILCAYPDLNTLDNHIPPPRAMSISEYDLILNEWSTCETTGFRPLARNHCAWEFIEEYNMFILFGGYRRRETVVQEQTGFLKIVHLYDPERAQWTQPIARGEAPVVLGGTSCIHGGVFYYYNSPMKTPGVMHLLDVSLGTVVYWSKPKIAFEGRISSNFLPRGMCQLRGMLVCLGTNTSEEHIETLRVYDPRTHRISLIRPKQCEGFAGYDGLVAPFSMNGGEAIGVFDMFNTGMRKYLRISVNVKNRDAQAV